MIFSDAHPIPAALVFFAAGLLCGVLGTAIALLSRRVTDLESIAASSLAKLTSDARREPLQDGAES